MINTAASFLFNNLFPQNHPNCMQPTIHAYVTCHLSNKPALKPQIITEKSTFSTMDEYPNEEEEFELMYGDEFDVLREHEDTQKSPTKARKSLNFTQDAPETATANDNSFERDFTIISDEIPANQQSATEGSKKRTIEELFGDIDDILLENETKRHKIGSDQAEDFALIEHIIRLRKLNKERDLPDGLKTNYASSGCQDKQINNLSYSVPRYNFIGVTRFDGVRIYVRYHSEEYEKEETLRVTRDITKTGLLGDRNEEIWKQAHALLEESYLRNTQPDSSQAEINNKTDNKSLWADLYKPRKYLELLSDESTNRILLKWLKLWDKIVFKRKPKITNKKPSSYKPSFYNNKKLDLNTELDDHGRPQLKVALLCGPPGLGKTTLAHMVARHCGYNVVEINASDDRSIEAFKNCLENATQMKSVLDRDNRPNCIVFDEIDGAPQSSIEYLVKFVQGTNLSKSKKKNKSSEVLLRRPIICICNDVYVPALRPLRQISFVINFPPTSYTRLAERLMEIARREKIKTDTGAMQALAQKSNNDIRSCLSVLHFYKNKDKSVTLSDIYRASVGQKDLQKGLFSVWQDIFLINSGDADKFKFLKNSTGFSASAVSKQRMDKVLTVVNSFGDFERVGQGVFENFPRLEYKNSDLKGTCEALDWFCYNDLVSKRIQELQNYSLTGYLAYAFVVWHFTFGTRSWQKLQYPSAGYEARMRRTRQQAIVSELLRGIQPNIRAYVQPLSLVLDVIPLLRVIISPGFRPISLHLYSKEERESLNHVVNVMVDYNLNYVQERTAEGTYDYKMDPNIDELVYFGPKRTLSYSNKQLIAKEIETAKMHRFEKIPASDLPRTPGAPKSANVHPPPPLQKSNLPNHLQTLQAKSVSSVEMPTVTKDFFGRVIAKTSPRALSGRIGPELESDVWFQYKEGYSNAVRKKIKVASLK